MLHYPIVISITIGLNEFQYRINKKNEVISIMHEGHQVFNSVPIRSHETELDDVGNAIDAIFHEHRVKEIIAITHYLEMGKTKFLIRNNDGESLLLNVDDEPV
jgi:hypothetical protein